MYISFARLAIEFSSFEENKRGGILIEDSVGYNVLHCRTFSTDASIEEHHERVDTKVLAVLVRLRQSDWFIQDDIQQNQLVHRLCRLLYIFPNIDSGS